MLKQYLPSGPTLARFHESDAFFRSIRGPIGSGKTTACIAEIIKRAHEQRPGPDGRRRTRWAAIRNTNYYEMGLLHPKCATWPVAVYADGYRDAIDAVDENGCVDVPEGPGLGVTYDWDYMEKHRTGGAEYK